MGPCSDIQQGCQISFACHSFTRDWGDFSFADERGLFLQKSRGEQILDDVKRRHPRSWLAIDNDDVGWPVAFVEKLICTDDVHGLSPQSVQAEMCWKFKAEFGKPTC